MKLQPKEDKDANLKFWHEKYDQNLKQTSKAYLDKILKSPVHKSECPNPLNPLNSWNLGLEKPKIENKKTSIIWPEFGFR